jgi:Zn-dependent peptidase ImmA (M78 family)/transcriptional regulator with XRE-family HTH domain
MVSIGHLLRDRRDAMGLSRDQVAEQAHVPEEVLAAFEESGGTITAAAVDRLAYVLAVDPFALREGRIEKRPTATVFFFQQSMFPDFRDAEDRPKLMKAFERALALVDVDAVLGRPKNRRLDFPAERPTPEAAKDGYRLANRVRAVLGNESAPMLDMAVMLEEHFGILIRAESLASTSISALTVKDNIRGAAAVILNTNNERRANPSTVRVDLAHELAHVLFDPADRDVDLVIDEDRDDDRSPREREGSGNSAQELSEKRARAFAAELLMPAEGLRALLGKPQYIMSQREATELIERVRDQFVTPIEIAVNHLVNREYVVHWLRQPLIDLARQREPRRAFGKPSTPAATRPDVLERRVLEALERDLITQERARELLGLSPWDELPTTA